MIQYLVCDDYYNYNHTGYIEEITDVFFVNDSINKTIDICKIKYEKCSLESIENNNLCLSCNIKNNYDPKLTSISNSFFDYYQ